MISIYTYKSFLPQYLDDKSLIYLSETCRYNGRLTREERKLRRAEHLGWNNLCRNGDLEGVKLLHKYDVQGCTVWAMNNAMDFAAKKGHLEVVKFLHENRSEGCTDYAMDLAAQNGHLEVVEYLKSIKTD